MPQGGVEIKTRRSVAPDPQGSGDQLQLLGVEGKEREVAPSASVVNIFTRDSMARRVDCASKFESIAAKVSARRPGSMASSAADMDARADERRSGTSFRVWLTNAIGAAGGTGARIATNTASGTPWSSSTGKDSRTAGVLTTPSLAKVAKWAVPPASATNLRNSLTVPCLGVVVGTKAMVS